MLKIVIPCVEGSTAMFSGLGLKIGGPAPSCGVVSGGRGLTSLSFCTRDSTSCSSSVIRAESYIEPKDVVVRLHHRGDAPKPLILDCRANTSFSERHIKGAYNVNCPSILLRRLLKFAKQKSCIVANQCSAILEKILAADSLTRICKDGTTDTVILYDEIDQVAEMDGSSVSVLLAVLAKDFPNVYVLKGGFSAFHASFPEHCEASSDTPQPSTASCTPVVSDSSMQPETFACRPTQVLPYLFLGNQKNSNCWSTLKECGITHVLNVAVECTNTWCDQNIVYKNIPLVDTTSQDLQPILEACFEFIDSAHAQGGCVLIHCVGGISRSAAVTLAYLMRTEWLTLAAAYDRLKGVRQNIAPNLGFMGQLLEFERAERERKRRSMGAESVWSNESTFSGWSTESGGMDWCNGNLDSTPPCEKECVEFEGSEGNGGRGGRGSLGLDLPGLVFLGLKD
eukprot:comp17132_c1_seq1/m.15918 comp17132_c1_seq1/g.15918  ORF comp17132_c1_seq1/g.15918 comp17132_c1_seq1/m.15918 type:complete len:453 (-) comp17132_c1_seq1:95-1453(-)